MLEVMYTSLSVSRNHGPTQARHPAAWHNTHVAGGILGGMILAHIAWTTLHSRRSGPRLPEPKKRNHRAVLALQYVRVVSQENSPSVSRGIVLFKLTDSVIGLEGEIHCLLFSGSPKLAHDQKKVRSFH